MTIHNAHMPPSSLCSDAPMRSRPIASTRSVCAIALLASCLSPTKLQAAPLLRCQIEQGGTSRMVDFTPVVDPYSVMAININDRFRFKAVVIGDALRVEYIKLYIYTPSKRQPILLHQTTYLTPSASKDAQPVALTGTNYVYSPDLERELQYGCALLETSP